MMLLQGEVGGGMFALAPLVIFLPVVGLLVNMAFGRRLGERFTGLVACSAIGLAFVVSVLQFIALQSHPEGATVPMADWITIGTLSVGWSLKIDTLSTTMMLMVSGVSTLIHIYAVGYMHEDVRHNDDPGRYTRFFVYFNLFVASMMVLVTGDSFLTLFVGWEGVGLCSYLLIGFWYEKGKDGIGNAVAGKKAFVTNRIGDFGFLIAMFLVFGAFGSLRFDEVFARAEELGPALGGVATATTLLLLLGASGKSAQLPLYVWLPDAMAGPTPVSALIHAATMVTAGIYMIARTHALFALAPFSANLVAWVGGLTALFAATIAVGQYDIKKVLAYSTISQLGFMVAAVGLGAYVAGMFHLLTHAFFKALLFLSAGSVILGMEQHHAAQHGHGEAFDPQDMRNMGGLRQRMPTTFLVYLVGALALAGIPPLAGFFSKDEILADASLVNPAVYGLLTAAAFLTAFYMGRQLLMVFFGKARSEAAANAGENPPIIVLPLIGLALLAAFGGVLNLPAPLPGAHALTAWLEHTIEHIHPGEFIGLVALLSTGLALVGLATAWLAYGRSPLAQGKPDPLKRVLGPVFVALENKYWVDELYGRLIIRPYNELARFLAEEVDWRWWHDGFHDGVLARGFQGLTRWLAWGFDLPVIDGAANRLAALTQTAAGYLRRVQTGYVRNYALSVIVGLVLILSYILFARLA
ncbi:MAG TPA: NADH-quinone oxidoreductase subunit L [Anaerolineales bacterium]|nr:NADH-quinone oxidoreductase subunit L [Anaerolineales bacterium]